MRSEWIRLVLMTTLLVLGGALEELLPRMGAMGMPVLLGLTIWFAFGGRAFEVILFAMAAGVFEEELSSLPMMSMVSLFVIVAVAVRWVRRKVVMV